MKKRNPTVITALQAFKEAVDRRDIQTAAAWYRQIKADYHNFYQRRTDEDKRSARQLSYSPERVQDPRESIHATAALRGSWTGLGHAHTDMIQAETILLQRGSFFRALRQACGYRAHHPSPVHPPITEKSRWVAEKLRTQGGKRSDWKAAWEARQIRKKPAPLRGEIDRRRTISRRSAHQSSWARDGDARHERVPPTLSKVEAYKKARDDWVSYLRNAYPGVSTARGNKTFGLFIASLPPDDDVKNLIYTRGECTFNTGVYLAPIMQAAGISAKDIAGKYWHPLSGGQASSPADFVRLLKLIDNKLDSPSEFLQFYYVAAPEPQVREVLRILGEDAFDGLLQRALLALPGTPSEQQCRQAINRANQQAERAREEHTLEHADAVNAWAQKHPGTGMFRKPAGWRWLHDGDGSFLCKWVAKSKACIVDRIIHGNMDDFIGVLLGPKGEVVGIERQGTMMRCVNMHACCDRHNKFDAAAWAWASQEQRMKTQDAERAARQQRIRLAREKNAALRWAKNHAPVGDARAERRAEARGDWLTLANPQRTQPLRTVVTMPNGARVLWTSQS